MGKIINIAVRDLIAKNPRQNEYEYVCGNSGFTVVFDFDEDWNEFDTKTARFEWNGKHQDVVFNGNQCEVPPEISDTNVVQVGVYTGNLHTTTPAVVLARKSILCGSGLPADPTPDVYAQLMEMLMSGNSPIKPFPVYNGRLYDLVIVAELEDETHYLLDPNSYTKDSVWFSDGGSVFNDLTNVNKNTVYYHKKQSETSGTISGNNRKVTYSVSADGVTTASEERNVNYLEVNNSTSFIPRKEYSPATKKYVDDSISGIVFPEFVQGNWNQNDPTADDYIKNRTHWVEGGGNTLEWDGNTDGLPQFSMDGITVYKVSDVVVGPSDLIGGTVTVLGAGEFPITAEMVNSGEIAGIGVYTVLVSDTGVVVVFNSDLSSDGLVIEKGTYFLSMGNAAYTSKLTVVNDVFGNVTIHKIDPKFISIGGYGYDNSEVLFDQTVEFADMGDGVMGYVGTFPKALENKTYKVTYNGVSYDCVPFDPAGVGMLFALGNAGPLGGSDTGEPFLMQVVDEDGDGVIDFMIADFNGATSAPVKVEIVDLHTIDPKFIPPATAETIGGVKVGDGLTVDGDGVLSAVAGGEEADEPWELIDEITFEEDAALSVSEEPDGTPYKFREVWAFGNLAPGNGPGDIRVGFNGTSAVYSFGTMIANATNKVSSFIRGYMERGYWRAEWSNNQNFFVWTPNITGQNRIFECPVSSYARQYITSLSTTGTFPAGSVLKIYALRHKE